MFSFFLSFSHSVGAMHTVYRHSYSKSSSNAVLHSAVFTVRNWNRLCGGKFEFTRINAGGLSLRFCGISYPNAVQMFGVQKYIYCKTWRFLYHPRSPNPTFPVGSSYNGVLCSMPWALPLTPALPRDHCISYIFPPPVCLWNSFRCYWPLKVKALGNLETSGGSYQATQRHMS
jgi:hypothetical protein